MSNSPQNWIRVAATGELVSNGCHVVQVDGRTLAVVRDKDRLYAVDNRCPHMGFPLSRGTVCDGILTCHWHHARFDLRTGGTFDQWADDVEAFPIEVRDDGVWIDLAPRVDPRRHQRERLQVGLQRNISLVTGKALLKLLTHDTRAVEPFEIGLEFGTRYRRAGWGAGLTIHVCLRNLLAWLDPADHAKAAFHGLAAIANDCDGQPPRFPIKPLPAGGANLVTLKRWFRQFIEVRDAEGAERCIASAVQAGADSRQMADLLFTAATDHRYIDIGHPLDFTNKALEALDVAGWKYAESALTSLAAAYASAERMEESNAWRHPIDLVALLDSAFEKLPAALERGRTQHPSDRAGDALIPCLLADDPAAIVDGLLDTLRDGCSPVALSSAVVHAAALRIARFPTTNEFRDWDTALHTFTFANAVNQGLRRSESPELLRGVFDAAMSVYLDRFLNVPAVPIPEAKKHVSQPEALLGELPALLDQRHEVQSAAQLVANYLSGGGAPKALMSVLGSLLLREDRDFHTIQAIEAAFRQHELMEGPAKAHLLIAAARYLAAHAPTMRSQEQTWRIAYRLHHGEKMFEARDAE